MVLEVGNSTPDAEGPTVNYALRVRAEISCPCKRLPQRSG